MNASVDTARPLWICHLCGQAHRPLSLKAGQRASCVRCASLLAKRDRFGAAAPLAFAATSAVLAIPAAVLPLMTVNKWGNQRHGYILTGFTALWRDGMHVLASLVLLCGIVLPLLLVATVAGTLLFETAGRSGRGGTMLRSWALIFQHWAMPEVYVLAVLVAFFKLGSSVEVSIGPGLWCYGAMSFAALFAWRSFDDPQKSRERADPDDPGIHPEGVRA
jgi:paraquat-inducible protein A